MSHAWEFIATNALILSETSRDRKTSIGPRLRWGMFRVRVGILSPDGLRLFRSRSFVSSSEIPVLMGFETLHAGAVPPTFLTTIFSALDSQVYWKTEEPICQRFL